MKQERVEFRTSHLERKQFEKAAQFLGMNLSSFLRMISLERSAEILKKSQSIILSDKDRDTFLEALENPPKPNKALKNALQAYRKYKNK